MKTETVKISAVKANPNNPRIIKDEKFRKLVKSIQEFPEMLSIRPIVVNDDMVVLGGNMRLKACKEAGLNEIQVIKASNLSADKQREFIIKDNVGFGEWDWQLINQEWDAQELTDWGLDIPGFKNLEAQDDDFIMPNEVQTDIVLGDLIEIGDHRLICGDSTESEVVLKVLNGKEPYLMVTDPPYGVNYDPQWRNDHNIKSGVGANRATGKVQNDNLADWTSTYALSPSKVAYVWHGGKHAGTVGKNLEDCEFEIRAQIIWAKQNLVMSRGHYHWQHEPCWYAVKRGNQGNWAGDRKQTTLWDIANNNPFGNQKKEEQTGHGTQKPVECMARPLKNHDGDVYDPFLGSGTTMVAAQQLGRKCYGVELDPKYCQIIVDRMIKLVPGIIIKINGNKYATTETIS